MTYDVAIAANPHDALLLCARAGLPSPVFTEFCDDASHSHCYFSAELEDEDDVRKTLERMVGEGIVFQARTY